MEGTVQTVQGPYDFRRHDQLWQRIGPGLEPYPQTAADRTDQSPGTEVETALTPSQAAALPGAEEDPCCMGTEAADLLAVIEGYIREEMNDRRRYLALARQAPAWSRQTLRQLAEDEGAHARRLMAVRYLITGRSAGTETICGPIEFGAWQEELRRSYHEEVCGGMNYARTADSTPDPCLAKILMELSADEYRHAQTVMDLLERQMRRRSALC